MEGGVKDNVLPSQARAVVNFRLFPGDTIAGVCERVRRVIGDEQAPVERLLSQIHVARPRDQPALRCRRDPAMFPRMAAASWDICFIWAW